MKPRILISWIARLGVAGVFVMAAVPKLTAQAEPVALFEQLGGSPMMFLTGVLELVAAVLGLGGMFPLAVVLFIVAGVVVWLHRAELPMVGKLACCSVKHADA